MAAVEHLTQEELATRLKRPVRTIERWRLTGYGPPFIRTGGGSRSPVRYPEAWVVEWEKSQLIMPGAKAPAA